MESGFNERDTDSLKQRDLIRLAPGTGLDNRQVVALVWCPSKLLGSWL